VLAIGIGMTNAVFTMGTALLYGRLSDADDRIMLLRTQTEHGRFGGVSRLDLEDWREGSRSFSGIAAHYTLFNMNVSDDTYVPESVGGTYLSVNAFRLLGSNPSSAATFCLKTNGRRPSRPPPPSSSATASGSGDTAGIRPCSVDRSGRTTVMPP
jgi:hypothetical protein